MRCTLNSSCLIATEQHASCSGGKINFWSHLGEERPEKPHFFHGNPSRGRLESTKSANKRSQKVTLLTCPRHFLETLISCRIYIPKNVILQVNPLETSLALLPVFPVLLVLVFGLTPGCYAATQLATQSPQRRIQVVRSNKVARKRLTESNGTPAMDLGHMNVVLK